MSSVALTEPLSTLPECYVCQDKCPEVFRCARDHAVCIGCLQGMVSALKDTNARLRPEKQVELLCGQCRIPIPLAMDHVGSPQEISERQEAYKREAQKNGATPEIERLDNIAFADDSLNGGYQEIVITFRVDPALEEEDRRCQRRSLCAMAGLVLGGIGILLGFVHQKGLI